MPQRKISDMFASQGPSPRRSQPDLPPNTNNRKAGGSQVIASNEDKQGPGSSDKNPSPRKRHQGSGHATAGSPLNTQNTPSAASFLSIPSTPPSEAISSQKGATKNIKRVNENVPETPQPNRRGGNPRAASGRTPTKPIELPPGTSPHTPIELSSGDDSSDSDCMLQSVQPTPTKKRKRNTASTPKATPTKRPKAKEAVPKTPTRAAAKQKPTSKQKQAVQKPAAKKPVAQTPVAQTPNTQKPAAQTPTTQKQAVQKPAAKKPTTQKTPARKPASQAPATQPPAAQKPAAQTPATQKPTAQKARAASLPPRPNPPTGSSTPAAANTIGPLLKNRFAIKAKFLKGTKLQASSAQVTSKKDDPDCFIEKVQPSPAPKRSLPSKAKKPPPKKRRVGNSNASVAVADNPPREDDDSDCEIVKVIRTPQKRASSVTFIHDENDADGEDSEEEPNDRKKALCSNRAAPARLQQSSSNRAPAKANPVTPSPVKPVPAKPDFTNTPAPGITCDRPMADMVHGILPEYLAAPAGNVEGRDVSVAVAPVA
ncbi:hypothetical protein EDB80DRAFT_278306 [Ilyonectria destructans]|nr:hypothetical protein EDB80DRAFT_278306 [Ilyonectria destructans]